MDWKTLDNAVRIEPGAKAPLTARDPVCDHLFADRAEAEASLDGDVKAIDKLQDRLWAERSRALLVVLQGMNHSLKSHKCIQVHRVDYS